MKSKKVLITLGVVLSLILLVVGAGVWVINSVLDYGLDQMITTHQVDKEDLAVSDEQLQREEQTKVTNIVVFGIDRNDNGTDGRSDAMKILSLDRKNNIAKITSIQRDMLIYIPGEIQDFDKLNHAYEYGGANLAMQTINYNFDLDLSRYITLNYEAIETIIDSIGGIDIYVGENEVPHIAEVDHSGWQTLTGAQAVGFMRVRYSDSDYGRMARQTEVITAAFSKVATLGYNELLNLLNNCLPYVETNLSKKEIIQLGLDVLKVDIKNIEEYQIPKNASEEVNQSVSYKGYSPLYVLDSYQQMVKDLHEGIYGPSDYEPSERIIETEAKIYATFGYQE